MNASHFGPDERVQKLQLEQVGEKEDLLVVIIGSEGTNMSIPARELLRAAYMLSQFLLADRENGKAKSAVMYV